MSLRDTVSVAAFVAVAAWLALVAAVRPAAAAQGTTGVPSPAVAEVIAEIQVHGNRTTPDAEIVAAAGIAVGDPFTTSTLASVRSRVDAVDRFDSVEVLKRFASIADPTRIAVVIVVDERASRTLGADVPGGVARVVGRPGPDNLMFLPVLSAEDGYGLTYGAEFALVEVGGERGRLSFPLTWGGERRAGAAYDVSFDTGPISHVQVGGALTRRRNPAFEAHDRRERLWARGERAFGPLSMGGGAAWEDVSFGAVEHRLQSVGVDVTVDTRSDPFLARNAFYARGAWTRVRWSPVGDDAVATSRARRTDVDLRGYLGLIRQSILVVRVQHQGTDAALPLYLKPLLGGWSSLRGFRAGAFVGDAALTGSLELRLPLSSTLSLARAGISVFADAGVTANHGERLRDQVAARGVGAGGWITATAFRLGVSVAHGRGSGTRLNFGGGFTF